MLQADGKKPIEFNPKAKSTFIAMGNIQAFNDGAKHYGVPVTELFQSADLYEGRKAQMLNVINCLNKLGFVVNNLFAPRNRRGFVCVIIFNTT